MAKDRIDRNELASKLVEVASTAEDPLRDMAEMIAQFIMEAQVTAKIGPSRMSAQRSGRRTAIGIAIVVGTRVWGR